MFPHLQLHNRIKSIVGAMLSQGLPLEARELSIESVQNGSLSFPPERGLLLLIDSEGPLDNVRAK
jgi:hypothetical protein